MEILDLTAIGVSEKHQLIFNKVRNMEQREKLCLKSEQDLVVVLSHIEEEYGSSFVWEYSKSSDGIFSLVIEKA